MADDQWSDFEVVQAPPRHQQQAAPPASRQADPWADFETVQSPQMPNFGAGLSGRAVVMPNTASQPMPEPQPAGFATHMLQGMYNMFAGGNQKTNPNVYHGDGNYLRKPLGEVFLTDGGEFYRGADGKDYAFNPAKMVQLVDPATGKNTAFLRDQNWEEGRGAALGRVITQGMLTGNVVGAPRTAQSGAGLAAARAQSATQDLQAFDNLAVRPFGPAFNQGPVASVAKQLSETPLIGAPVRNALDESIAGAGRAAEAVASRYGDAANSHDAGRVAQQGIERFRDARPMDIVEEGFRGGTTEAAQRISETIASPARDTSLKTKQAALYERAWNLIPEEMRAGRSVEGTTRVMAQPAETRGVLADIMNRNRRMTVQSGANAATDNVVMPVRGGLLGAMLEAVNNPRWTANLQTMRDMRSTLRRLASGMPDTERNTLALSDIERLQSALTRDMVGLLQRNAEAYREAGNAATAAQFERSIREFARADQFTRLSAERLSNIERLFNANSVESLARSISNAALTRGQGNLDALRTLRRTLRPEEMDQVTSAVIREMGQPVGSAQNVQAEVGFSPSSFMTRWRNMEPAAQATLFNGQHRQAINDLVRVSERLAHVEAQGNVSRSGTNAVNLGGLFTAGGAIMSGADAVMTLLGTAATGAGAAVLFAQPAYARWTAQYARLRAARMAGIQAAQPALAVHVERLAQMGVNDPELLQLSRAIAAENGIAPDRRDRQNQQR
jgi:hypothetical protein